MQESSKDIHKLYRSRTDRYVGGVCGGIAEYFRIDSNLVRIIFVISLFFGGLGLFLYIAALIIVPENPGQESVSPAASKNSTLFWGLLFVGLGALLLFRELGLFSYFYFRDIPWTTIWAVFLIAIGVGLLFTQSKKRSPGEDESASEEFQEGGLNIYRSRSDRKIAGVCGGLAKYLNLDSSLVRLAWVLATLGTAGLGIPVYILFIFVFPEESSEQAA